MDKKKFVNFQEQHSHSEEVLSEREQSTGDSDGVRHGQELTGKHAIQEIRDADTRSPVCRDAASVGASGPTARLYTGPRFNNRSTAFGTAA